MYYTVLLRATTFVFLVGRAKLLGSNSLAIVADKPDDEIGRVIA